MLIDYLRSLLFSNAPLRSAPSDNRPTGAQLRNPADSVQAARIEAAVAKRERKAEMLVERSTLSFINNWSTTDRRTGTTPNNLNPFYIAK